MCLCFFFSSRRRHTRCALVTGVQTCALPISISKVASAMVEVLPCYTASDLCEGERSPHLIDAVFVEGHTDSDVMSGGMNNYGLSVRRAETTFTMLQRNQPALRGFLNRPAGEDGSAPILSLSGHGPDRPVDRGDSEEEIGRPHV